MTYFDNYLHDWTGSKTFFLNLTFLCRAIRGGVVLIHVRDTAIGVEARPTWRILTFEKSTGKA